MLRAQIETAIREMPLGSHAVLVYDSEENKRDVLFSHLKAGVGRSGLVYACSDETPEQIEGELASSGVDVSHLKRDGMLDVVDAEGVYLAGGVLDPPKVAKSFSDRAFEFRSKGYEGIRASAEMTCVFRKRGAERLVEYEEYLHRHFSFPAIGVCGYNLVALGNSGRLELLWPVLRAHAVVIMTGPNGAFALEPEKVDRSLVKERTGLTVPAAP